MNEFKLWKSRAEMTNNMWFALNATQVRRLLSQEYGTGVFEKSTIADEVSIESKIRFVMEKHLKQRGFKIDPDRKWSYDGDINLYIPFFQDTSGIYPVVAMPKEDLNESLMNFVRFPIKKYV